MPYPIPVGLTLVFLLTGILLFLGNSRLQRRRLVRTYQTHKPDFDQLLARYNPYYRRLSGEGRDRFLKRVLVFMEYKKFEYIDIQGEERMPLLISAAAVQLTFGLESFLLAYFRTIYIVR